ncbi:MAG TPA: TlpA disulfide reductase family protein [Candidatus Hydrogenedentes bacterium]|nr:TlpA disulfide reductase family protein [Candidatus Hydrogenedentota bacterium]HPC18076.1 TlpA disulfide reductase family protein [Candidatus Hydrogenedentota bacterium]HRT21710.1 TlpA disulfide reductase family protein [Candidatus Hydrogenedentota bacterium]HRT66551.1 TlpA disulfide reductase family protein [Candidatus Hydrogenedentota bacterium]
MGRVKAFYGTVAVLGGFVLITYWGMMVVWGSGSWLHGTRSLRLGPIYVPMLLLGLATLIVLPAFLLSVCRIMQTRGRFPRWTGLPGASCAMAWQALLLAALVLVFDTPWSGLFRTDWAGVFRNAGKPAVLELGDDHLNYPELPLQPVDYYAWSVYDLDGREVPMASFRGKTLFLNFWATWCMPCRSEMPSVQRLYDAAKDKGVAFAFVSREEAETVRTFMKAEGYTLPVYLAKERPPAFMAITGIPATMIFAPDGQLAFRHTGAAAWDTPKTLEFLAKLTGVP